MMVRISSHFLQEFCLLQLLLSYSFTFVFQMHADDFRYDRHGVVSGLRDGGYSDDMTLAAIAGNSFLKNLIN